MIVQCPLIVRRTKHVLGDQHLVVAVMHKLETETILELSSSYLSLRILERIGFDCGSGAMSGSFSNCDNVLMRGKILGESIASIMRVF